MILKEDLINNFELKTKVESGKKIYYFKCDEGNLDELKKKFVLSVYPHQWWGNVIDPKVVVLALNPGYSAGADELDSLVFGDLIEKNYKLKNGYGQFLFGDRENESKIPFKYSSISKWWRNVFEDIIEDDLPNDYDKKKINKFNNNVGIFNLVGYQSRNAKNTNIDCKSKKTIIEHIKALANDDEDRFFIFVWGKSTWEASGLEIKNNFIEVNKRNSENDKICSQNKKLNVKIEDKNDRKLLKKILLNEEIKEDTFKKFMKKYNEDYRKNEE